MVCGRCGYRNKKESRFCIKCGQRLNNGASVSGAISGELNIGSLLQGRYKIVKQIGKGGMGVVYLANDNRFSNRVCVIKEMIEYLSQDSNEEKEKAVVRFKQEADLLATINHGNVPQVYDRFSERSRHYLVMEFVAGMDLREVLNEYMKTYSNPLPEEDVIIYFMQLCATLKYLHGHQPTILHRDIKPQNIILTREGKIKLVDFGIAKTIQANSPGTSIGTQGYAAPEQYKGLADERTDIYALGATVHHLLSGRDPQFQTPFDYPTLRVINSSISEELSRIIEWMLQMNTDSRPRNIDMVMNAIKTAYLDIEQKMLDYPGDNNKVLDIVNSKLSIKNEFITKNICSSCGHENKATSKFCVKCGSPIGNSKSFSGATSNNTISKMIIQSNSKIMLKYPNGYNEFIKIPDKSGNAKVNVILGKYIFDNEEYVYVTEKSPSVVGQEVFTYNVVRNEKGSMKYIKPVTDSLVKAKLYNYWLQLE